MSIDLYAELEVSKGSSDAEIKKAYKKLARKHHPDVNKEAGAEAKFKRIQKAYEILSDPQKKQQYDQFGIADDSPGGGQGGGGGFGDFEDVFEVFFGGQRQSGGGRRGPARGDDLRYDMTVTLEEAQTGADKHIEVYHLDGCSRCKGDCAEPGYKKTTCNKCGGQGQVKVVQRTFLGSFQQVSTCPDCRGQGEKIDKKCTQCQGRGVEKKRKKLEVSIPAGVESGVRLRVTGEGNKGESGGPAGDLYVFIEVKEHQFFQREEDDIFIEINVPFTELILGAEIEVPTLGGAAMLKIPAGTQTNTKFRLKGKGMPHLKGYSKGDQYVIIRAELPKSPTSEEKKLIKKIQELAHNPKKKKSLFDCVKRQF